ncbi:hypothetical protein GQ44DRAFT_776482 [Phaeosphaeriaceae sp. PMI808]|nr:hypothetical protein GQ44DRAFT_776482 [Phaeosphaeriaceae sp. PMI808]
MADDRPSLNHSFTTPSSGLDPWDTNSPRPMTAKVASLRTTHRVKQNPSEPKLMNKEGSRDEEKTRDKYQSWHGKAHVEDGDDMDTTRVAASSNTSTNTRPRPITWPLENRAKDKLDSHALSPTPKTLGTPSEIQYGPPLSKLHQQIAPSSVIHRSIVWHVRGVNASDDMLYTWWAELRKGVWAARDMTMEQALKLEVKLEHDKKLAEQREKDEEEQRRREREDRRKREQEERRQDVERLRVKVQEWLDGGYVLVDERREIQCESWRRVCSV